LRVPYDNGRVCGEKGNNKKEELAHALHDADKKTPEYTKVKCNSCINFVFSYYLFSGCR